MERPEASSIPVTPGVYLYRDAQGKIIYVGKARNLRRRILSYFRPRDQLTPKTAAMIGHAVSLETLNTTTEKEALLLEASLIKKHRPHYNIVLRDDKQYVLFRLAEQEEFPRLEVVRKVRRRDGARYFGPFTSAQAARETWKSIHRIFPLRRCSNRAMKNRVRPCLYHHIGLCLAPCSGEVDRKEYADMTRRVSLLMEGKSRELLDMLRESMEKASEDLDFERAAVLRDQLRAVEKTVERQGVVLQKGGDMDVMGVVTRPYGLALGVIFVRQGVVQDRSTFFWPGLGLEEADELILSFISQFYGPHSAVPPRVVIPWLPGGGEDESPADQENSGGEGESALASLASALADLRGGPVYISAPRNADENRLVDMAKSNAREAARGRADMPLSERLKLVLHASRPIERIECVDVSHTGGQATKVGMVVYEEGRPRREDYRVWNIEGAGGDDYAALSMWAERRLEHGAPWPDLLLIDGGRGQLAAVYRVLCEGWSRGLAAEHEDSSLPFLAAGIAKARDERGHADRRAGNVADRIFVPGRSNPLNIREGSPELLFLQSVRDATHDFSIGRHRQARAKQAFSGELQRLPGVGPATAKLLWEHFSSIADMKAAAEEDIARLPGIGRKRAGKIWASLREL